MKTGNAGTSVLGATNAEAHGGDVLFILTPSSNELAAAQLPPIRYIADHCPIASLLICRDRYPKFFVFCECPTYYTTKLL